MRKFAGTERTIRKARKQVAEQGIFVTPTMKKPSRHVSKEAEEDIQQFFERDDIRRLIPEMKDFATFRGDDGTKQKRQKWFILADRSSLWDALGLYLPTPPEPEVDGAGGPPRAQSRPRVTHGKDGVWLTTEQRMLKHCRRCQLHL